jgi:hypothetical protein
LLLVGLLFWLLPLIVPATPTSGLDSIGLTLLQALVSFVIEIGKWIRPVGVLLLGFLALSRAPLPVLALFGISLNFTATLSGLVLMLLILAKAEVKPAPLLLALGGLLFLSTCFLNTGLSSLIWLWKKVAESKKDWWLTPLFNRPPPDSLRMFAGSVIGLSLLSILPTVIVVGLAMGLRLLNVPFNDFLSLLVSILFFPLRYF